MVFRLQPRRHLASIPRRVTSVFALCCVSAGSTVGQAAGGSSAAPVASTESIDPHVARIADLLEENRIGEARELLLLLAAQADRDGLSTVRDRTDRLNDRAREKADSLVLAAVAAIRERGPEAATEIRDRLFMDNGLAEDELARVDEAIGGQGPGSEHRRAGEIRLRAEAALSEGIDPSTIADPETREVAYQIAESRADSLREAERLRRRIERGEQKLLEQREEARRSMRTQSAIRRIDRAIEEGRPDEAVTVFGIYEASLERDLMVAEFQQLRGRVQTAYSDYREQSRLAAGLAEDIGARIDDGAIEDAKALFEKSREALAKGLGREHVEELAEAINRAKEDQNRRIARARSTAARIHGLLAEGKVERAERLYRRHRDDLQRYLIRKIYRNLRSELQAAVTALKNKERWARTRAREIEGEIARRNGSAALASFVADSAQLRIYLDSVACEELRASSIKADAEYRRNASRARETAGRIGTMLEKKRPEEAYRLFAQERGFLEHYMGEGPGYGQLRDWVNGDYAALQANRRNAAQTVRAVEDLIARREGEQAYALYTRETGILTEFADPAAAAALGDSVARARTEYRANLARSRLTVKRITQLLDRQQIEAAYTMLRDEETDLDHYLASDAAYAKLRERVLAGYRAWQDSTRLATRTMRRIGDLVARGEGAGARAEFSSGRGLLAAYLDAATVADLDRKTLTAERDQARKSREALESAGRIDGLLARKKTEEAWTAFDASRSNLERYLDRSRYDTLAASVARAHDALLEKQREALRHVRAINGLIRQDRGREARAELQRRGAVLREHLAPESFDTLEARVSRAKRDYDEAESEVRGTAGRIRNLLSRDSVVAAHEAFRDNVQHLEHYLGKKEFGELQHSVARPYERLRAGQRKARQTSFRINWMMVRKRTPAARELLLKELPDLRANLSPRDFENLAARVDAEYQDHRKRSAEAAATASEIERALGRGKVDDAYARYRRDRGTLKTYLTERDFARLTDKVTRTRDELAEERRKARARLRNVYRLLRRGEPAQAYREFRRHRTHLERYLEGTAYRDLRKEVLSAARAR